MNVEGIYMYCVHVYAFYIHFHKNPQKVFLELMFLILYYYNILKQSSWKSIFVNYEILPPWNFVSHI